MHWAPETTTDDERFIARGYQTWLTPLLALIPFGVASYADTKWVVATGFAVTLYLVHEIGGRLYDLCIRARRTNLLLSQERGVR
jgi:hypothetical protein